MWPVLDMAQCNGSPPDGSFLTTGENIKDITPGIMQGICRSFTSSGVIRLAVVVLERVNAPEESSNVDCVEICREALHGRTVTSDQ